MNAIKLQVAQIVNGNFSDVANGAKGNFTGYDLQGNQYFIAKAKVNAIGIEKDADFKPFYITVTERTYNELDDEGAVVNDEDGNPKTFNRTQAGAVFAERSQAMDATLDSKFFELEQAKAISDKANELELSEDAVKKLVASL